jgi:hypothetical protein
MKKLFALMILVGSVGTAIAGLRSTWPVRIDLTNRWAYGSIGDARASSDPLADLGCELQTNPGYVPLAYCFARLTGQYVSCYSQDPNVVTVAAAVRDGYLTFNWDSSGKCTHIGTDNTASTTPKQP